MQLFFCKLQILAFDPVSGHYANALATNIHS